MAMVLRELAERLGVELRGDGRIPIAGIASLEHATPEHLSYLADPRHRKYLARSRAGAVVAAPQDAEHCPAAVLVSEQPHLTFTQAARLLHPPAPVIPGCHPSAVIDPGARIDSTASIGPLVVIETGAEIGPRVFVGPGCVIGAGVRVGADSRLVARVTLCSGTLIGARALIQPGAVIGREGFGFARDGERWLRIPQIGRAVLGDDVEVGANTTIDRGAMTDTRIGDGVKLDNQIQIGHNVEIGDHTAIAANTGISGSTRIGRHCTIAGAVGMAGHLRIGDGVHFTGMAMVTRSFEQPGSYSGGLPAMPSAEWRRGVARFRQLDALARKLKAIEQQLDTMNDSIRRGDA